MAHSSLPPALHQIGDNLATALCTGHFSYWLKLFTPEFKHKHSNSDLTDFFAEVLADRPSPTGFQVSEGPGLPGLAIALKKSKGPLFSLDLVPELPASITPQNFAGSLQIDLAPDPDDSEITGLELSAILYVVLTHSDHKEHNVVNPPYQLTYFWLCLPEAL